MQQPAGVQNLEDKYLVFQLGKDEFGMRVRTVKEIVGLQEITAIPQAPPYVLGVVNLRGQVIPVIDLRRKFRMPEARYTERTCIIVVQLSQQGSSALTGVVVDGVAEVMNIGSGEIQPAPDLIGGGDAGLYCRGMANVKGRLKILLDINRVMGKQ